MKLENVEYNYNGPLSQDEGIQEWLNSKFGVAEMDDIKNPDAWRKIVNEVEQCLIQRMGSGTADWGTAHYDEFRILWLHLHGSVADDWAKVQATRAHPPTGTNLVPWDKLGNPFDKKFPAQNPVT